MQQPHHHLAAGERLLPPLPHRTSPDDNDNTTPFSSPVYVSQPSSRQPSPLNPPSSALATDSWNSLTQPSHERERTSTSDAGAWGFDESLPPSPSSRDSDTNAMPSDLRPNLHKPMAGSQAPLLSAAAKGEDGYAGPVRPGMGAPRRSTFRKRESDAEARSATRKRYTYAAGFLVLSLVSFVVQTETAVYIQHRLKWNKAYAMLYFTHGSWSLLWFVQLLILRLSKYSQPFPIFWRRHLQLLRQTAQMVQHQDTSAPQRHPDASPIPYMLRTIAICTTSLTVAGGSWYVAVDMTTASDLTAIYNCSAFFAYVFSIFFLRERVRSTKILAVAVAIAGVLIVAYGDVTPAKHGSKSGGGAGGPDSAPGDGEEAEGKSRALGNVIIGVGSVLYGLYEVLYKWLACPPDGTSPGRSMIFANMFGTCMGLFTLCVLWIPLPILHYTGVERFELPRGEAAWMMAISVLANAVFSGSFLTLISLTSPVLSSVAALLTIFLVAIVDQLLPPPLNNPLSGAAVTGGLLIIVAFAVLSWATYAEMEEERRRGEVLGGRVGEGEGESDVEG